MKKLYLLLLLFGLANFYLPNASLALPQKTKPKQTVKAAGKKTSVPKRPKAVSSIKIHAIKVEGSLELSEVEGVFQNGAQRDNLNSLKPCFDKSLIQRPDSDIKGNLSMQFALDPDGRALEPKIVETDFKNKSIDSCLQKKIRPLNFPKGKGNRKISVIFEYMISSKSQENPAGGTALSWLSDEGTSGKPVLQVKDTGIDNIKIEGALEPAPAEDLFHANKPFLNQCYQDVLPQNPTLAGKVKLKFTINPDGTISKSKISETDLKNSDFEKCISKRIKAIQFPKSNDGEKVQLTLDLTFAKQNK